MNDRYLLEYENENGMEFETEFDTELEALDELLALKADPDVVSVTITDLWDDRVIEAYNA